MRCVLETIRSITPLSAETERLLLDRVSACRFARRDVMVCEGKRSRYAYFVERGLTRSYWQVDGEEVTTSFSTEGSIVFSMDEVYYGLESQEYVQAIEEVEAYAISVESLRELVDTNIELARWWATIHQNEYRRLHQSHKERLTLPAAERYRSFCRQFPEVSRRAPLGYIASYLGITRSTLSRLRRKS